MTAAARSTDAGGMDLRQRNDTILRDEFPANLDKPTNG
jgi:hypothetical protein